MKARLLPVMFAVFALSAAAFAQDSGSAPPASQNPGQGNGGGSGQRGGRGGYGGMGIGAGRGLMGTVNEVAADHYTIKTEMGDVYTVHFTSDTRITRQAPGMRGPGGGGGGQGNGGYGGGRGRGGYGGGGNPPQQIKPADIKVGDVIGIMGEPDAAAKSVNARAIVQMDPERVKQLRDLEANFGKTWLQGNVTAIDGTKITLTGSLDNAPHTVVVDENTQFRKRKDPVTLADIQVGDNVRLTGLVKDGVFTATLVNAGGNPMTGGPSSNGPSGPPSGAPPGPPPGAPPQ